MFKLFQQLVLFTGVGCFSAIGHYGLLITLVQGFGVEPVRASVAGALLGACINYALNYRYTFRSSNRHRESVVKFAIVAIVGLLFNTFFMWLGVVVLGINYLLTQVLTTGLIFFWHFGANRIWTFRVATRAN